MNHSETRIRTLVFSPAIRIFHWLRALTILVLVITGFYIAWPFLVAPESTDVLVQGWIRFAHLICVAKWTFSNVARFNK